MIPRVALISVISATIFQCVSSAVDPPTVKLSGGILSGKYLTSRDGLRYEAFLGIHFGTVADRFENSVLDTSTWSGVREATEYGPVCAQKFMGTEFVNGKEDCLFLNVFTPKVDNKKRPVTVFIHGGAFTMGGTDNTRAKYFMDEDVILVTITYRLGVLGRNLIYSIGNTAGLGFLSTGDDVVPGNMGLRDQVVALQWVQQNIAAFGGDSNKVTIFGESAGAASVNFLLLSPLAKGLFQNAISLSGVATNPWAFRENTLTNSIAIGEKLGCTTSNTNDLVACLRGIPMEQLLIAQSIITKWHMDPIVPFSPTLEIKTPRNPEPFLDRKPIEVLKSGDFNRVPVILTMNKDEGIILHAAVILRNEALRQELNDDWDRIAPITFMHGDEPTLSDHVKEISTELRQFYFGNADITLDNERNLTDLYTDSWFLKGIHDTAFHLAKHVPVFTGQYTHERKDYSIASFFGITEILGVSHGDDIPQLFNFQDDVNPDPAAPKSPFTVMDVSEPDDVQMSRGFVKIVASFARTGAPEVTLGTSPSWPPVTKNEIKSRNLNWFNICLKPSLDINPFKTRIAFWDNIYKKGSKKSTKTEL